MTSDEMMAAFDNVRWMLFCYAWGRIGKRYDYEAWIRRHQ